MPHDLVSRVWIVLSVPVSAQMRDQAHGVAEPLRCIQAVLEGVIAQEADAKTTTETAYALTSVSAERAGPAQLLAWNRGHWMVENANHYRRDATLGEDASRIRARHAPANNATLNNIALAIVFHRGFHHLPDAQMHFMMRREDALDAILSPT